MTKSRGHVPVRTCIVCGAKRPKHVFLRLALSDSGEIREDVGKNLGGRGAYLCNRPECRGKLSRHRTLSRVFRTDRKVRLPGTLLKEPEGQQGPVSVPQGDR